nr:MAG TPA: hypothetical protein [Caudoviricetes sp.]
MMNNNIFRLYIIYVGEGHNKILRRKKYGN